MRVYPVDGVKAACCGVTVKEQSALGTLAMIACGDVKIEGLVLFNLHAITHYGWACARKKKSKSKAHKSWKALFVEAGGLVRQVQAMVF
jgi:hypothetical protein